MTRVLLATVTLLALLSAVVGQDLRVVAPPVKAPADGKVPVYEWEIEWALRDDKKPSLGDLASYKTFAAARERAEKVLAGRTGEKTDWTYIKFVQIRGTAGQAEVSELDPKRAALWKAIQAGVDKKAEACNRLVQDIADAAGVNGLADKTADQMWGYFNTAAEKDGWKEVKGEKAKGDMPAVSAIEAANRLAEGGQLVVGVISTDLLNKYKAAGREDYKQGHVFVVAPVGGVDWKSTLTANAVYDPKTPTAAWYTPANKVIATVKQRDAVQFYAIPLPKK